jgi:hypothetical protein
MQNMDGKEKVRKFINMQYVKMKRMASVGGLILLAINLSLTIYPFVEFRFQEYMLGIPRAWIGIPVILLIILFLLWVGSHIYISIMEMYRTEFLAEKILNPYTVYAIGPFEEMLYRTMTIPTLEASYMSMPDGKEKEGVKKNLDLAKKWVDMGYIPKEDFPKHLKKYYITNKERRL